MLGRGARHAGQSSPRHRGIARGHVGQDAPFAAAFGDRVPILEAVVPYSVRLKEAPLAQATVLEYASKTAAADAYRRLAATIDDQ